MTAWRKATSGLIPGSIINPAGRWVVEVAETGPHLVVAYVRVSSDDQKFDLDRQVARIAEWASGEKVVIDRYVREIGSGLSDRRKELDRLLGDSAIKTIVVEHRDRLARFGVRQIEQALRPAGRGIRVINASEISDDLAQDMVDLMTCFSARLYGRRSARNRAKRAMVSLSV